MDGVTLDLYVCNYSQDNRAAAETAYSALRAELKPGRIMRHDVARGSLAPAVPDSANR
jgi:S-adenosylmethionine/arginine decarboxylase-like enzyme